MGYRVARWEIAAQDLKAVREFYANLFDWDASAGNTRYSIVRSGEGIDGLIFKADDGLPTFVTFYVEVEDLNAHLAKAESLGATVYVPPTPSPVPGERFFAVFGDPEGNIVGLVQRAQG